MPVELFDTCFYTKAFLKVELTLSFDVEVFTLMTGSPFDLSITTVLSVPRLARKQNTSKNNMQDIKKFLPRFKTAEILTLESYFIEAWNNLWKNTFVI